MRPFWALTKDEIAAVYAKRPEIKRAWTAAKENGPFRQTRGLLRGMFILGWLACTQHYEARLEEMAEAIESAANRAAATQRARWIVRSKLEQIDLTYNREGEADERYT
jgi:hypothetical protein